MGKLWKKGRGKLGPFAPLLGEWVAESDSPMGRLRCYRTLRPVLGGKYLQLDARCELGPGGAGRAYEERALIGAAEDGVVRFWSFTSDGKRSVESKTKKGWNRFVEHRYHAAPAT